MVLHTKNQSSSHWNGSSGKLKLPHRSTHTHTHTSHKQNQKRPDFKVWNIRGCVAFSAWTTFVCLCGFLVLGQTLRLSHRRPSVCSSNVFKVNISLPCSPPGYVLSIMGRRRSLPHIRSPDWATRMQAERQAVNFTVQGQRDHTWPVGRRPQIPHHMLGVSCTVTGGPTERASVHL